ncbi:hypothetical protein C8F04DRAFT_1395206 [Mycena alexandri]|uniref:WSC domain-containing protein n=1 Tax=Mycena alexandri TaxID=1745969 RepID=A0AAD6SVJ7_9AGAR|nr:hypothetical protein C8F04DRAFT_1395206 [Mycena alexandri]
MTPLYLNALFSLLVARVVLSAAAPGKRQVYYTTSPCTDTATVTSTDWYTITETPIPIYTETDIVTDTETATVTYTETDSVTATETDSVTTTETDSVTATETTSFTATETDSVTVTKTTTATVAPPSQTATWVFRGCYHDSISPRTLPTLQKYGIADNSVASCQAFCLKNAFAFAGVEDAGQCFCAHTIRAGVTTGATCNSKCTGGVGTCGGVDAIDIYQATDIRTA